MATTARDSCGHLIALQPAAGGELGGDAAVLKPGDEIWLGSARLRFKLDYASGMAPPPREAALQLVPEID